MPTKEIKELRQAGKLDEAYSMAKAELQVEPENIWSKRNMSWVLYNELDRNAEDLSLFLQKIEEVKLLELPATEEMFFENISIVIAKAARFINSTLPIDYNRLHGLYDAIRNLPIKKNSKWYSVLYSAFHKGIKESYRYIEFADWWGFQNFRPEDFQKERLPNGKDVMALAEQAYIAYAKHLLPKRTPSGELIFNKEKAESFLPVLSEIINQYPQFQYPAYFKAKLLLALGDNNNMLESILPFARKKQNDFWVWQILAEVFSNEPEKVFSCYCKSLSCKSPEEMLVKMRQKMATLLIAKNLYNEAKTEIDLLVLARTAHGFKIPNEVINWQTTEWYRNAIASNSNFNFYKHYLATAESLLFSDIPEELIIVDFVNSDKKILNFIASETKFGFFKYERFFKQINIGDILKVRFQGGSKEGMHKLYTAVKANDEEFKRQFFKEVSGSIKVPPGKTFGFIEDVFIHPSLISRLKLTNGMPYKGKAMKSYNKEKKQWSWKLSS